MRIILIMLVSLLLTILAAGQATAGNATKGKLIYMVHCIACHNVDPSKNGAIGPAVKGSSKALVTVRVLSGTYPKGYKPKRPTKLMVPLPHLKPHIEDLAAFLK